MKKNDIFKHISDEDAAKIAAEYPTGDKKQRDLMFKKVESRLNGSFTAENDTVRAEAYRPRIAMKVASAAAALVLVGGTAGVAYKLHNDGGKTSESNFGMAVSEPSSAEETSAEAVTVSGKLTREELLDKIKSRDYTSFDRISMKYRETRNGISFMDGVIRRDGSTGNESMTKTWTHTPDYFKDIDADILAGTTPEELAKTHTQNEMFFAKDMFICVYTDTSENGPGRYEISDRSTYPLDQPTAFTDTYSEYIIRDLIDYFDVKEITENTTFGGRDCTDVLMTYDGIETLDDKTVPVIDPAPPTENAPFYSKWDQDLSLTIDNETGLILKARLSYGDAYYEEFEVTEIKFNDSADLPENGEYIRNRIAECVPINNSASYDLSVLD